MVSTGGRVLGWWGFREWWGEGGSGSLGVVDVNCWWSLGVVGVKG